MAGFRATLEEVVEAPKRCRPSRDDFKRQCGDNLDVQHLVPVDMVDRL